MGDASLEDLTTPPADGANPAAWIIWHLARVQDHHVAGVAGAEQLWVTADWPLRFGLRPDANDTGNRHSAEQVRGVRPDSVEALLGYLDAVAARTRIVLGALTDDDLDRVVDTSYDPPVTVGVASSASPTTTSSTPGRSATSSACSASSGRVQPVS